MTTPSTPPTSLLDILWRPFAAWNRFWFTPGDPTVLGLVRICAGLLILYVHIGYCFDLQELVGEHAWLDMKTVNLFRHEAPVLAPSLNWDDMPRQLPPPASVQEQAELEEYAATWEADRRLSITQGRYLSSFWYHVTDPTWMKIVHGLCLVTILLFTLGVCTRVTAALTWVIVLSFIQRAMTTLFGMDTIMIVVLVYLVIGPSGAALSVDRLVARYLQTRRALRRQQPAPSLDRPEPSVSANFTIRIMQVHIALIYLAAGLSKLQGSTWWSGNAVWGTMANYEFSPMGSSLYMEYLRTLSRNRFLWEVCMSSSTLFTLMFEISFAFLVWSPRWRWFMLLCSVFLHTGIAFFMGLVGFSLMMMVLLISFIPPEAARAFLRMLSRSGASFKLYFSNRERRQVRVASLVHAVDAWNQVELVNVSGRAATALPAGVGVENAEAKLVTRQGEVLHGYDLFNRLARSLRPLWPVGMLTWLPGLSAVGRAWFGGAEETKTRRSRAESREPVSPAR